MTKAGRTFLVTAGLLSLVFAAPSEAGLIAYWDFNAPAVGSDVADVSGNSIVGVLGVDASLTTGSLGYTGEALDVTSTEDESRMIAAASQFTPYNPGMGDFSVSFWIKPTVLGGVVDHAGTNGYDIALNGGPVGLVLVLGSGGKGGGGWEVPATADLTVEADDTWQHVALVVDRTNAKF